MSKKFPVAMTTVCKIHVKYRNIGYTISMFTVFKQQCRAASPPLRSTNPLTSQAK